jgi:hypothetical protein
MRKPLVRLKHICREVKAGMPKHLVDSTALLTASNPFFSTFESMAAGMTNEDSIHARGVAAGLTYLGMGKLYIKGLEASRSLFKINRTTSEKLQHLHDAGYSIAYNLVISPPFYLIAGVRDPEKIAIGTATAVGLALVAGGPMGYVVDAFGDLTGLKPSDRVPRSLESLAGAIDNRRLTTSGFGYASGKLKNSAASYRKFKPRTKKGIVAACVAASIGAMALIYQVNSHYVHPQKETPQSLVQAR